MKCPVCSVDLVMSERQGIEIDYCPKCRGIWLDRGELDKIIEKSASSNVGGYQEKHEGYRGKDDHYPEYKKHRQTQHLPYKIDHQQ